MSKRTTRFWLMKSEPDVYSIDTLMREGKTHWEGVRNYQARNYMRDEMKLGDMVLFYHSSTSPPGVAGLAKVCQERHQDPTAWNPTSKYADPKASENQTIWEMISVEFVEKFPRLVPLDEMRSHPSLAGLMVIRKGIRLSVQPVEKAHFDIICRLGRNQMS